MPSELWNFIKNTKVGDGRLPPIHNTDVALFQKIRKTSILEPQERKEYDNERLLFFFLGRPSYRPHGSLMTVNSKAFAPICFVMNRDILDYALRIMPFDSGAFSNGELCPPLHPSMEREGFELMAHRDAPMKLIKVFYGSESNYFDSRPNPTVDFNPWENLIVDCYDKLIRNQTNTKLDDRISSIELQVSHPVELKNRVLAVVLPKEFMDHRGVLQQIESWGTRHAIPYDLPDSFVPREISGSIRQILRDFFISQGFL